MGALRGCVVVNAWTLQAESERGWWWEAASVLQGLLPRVLQLCVQLTFNVLYYECGTDKPL